MIKKVREITRILLILTVVTISSALLPPQPVSGGISACSGSVAPHMISPGSQQIFSFEVSNNDANSNVAWVAITRPSDYFTILNASAPGWVPAISDNSVKFSGGSLAPGATSGFSITTDIADNVVINASWQAQVSEDGTGLEPAQCSGDFSVTSSAENVPPIIDNLAVSNLTAASTTISWTTHEPASSQIYYGESTGYGSQSTLDTTLRTTHVQNLGPLDPNTVYHYQVISTDNDGNETSSSDNTFITPAAALSSSGDNTENNNTTGSGSNAVTPGRSSPTQPAANETIAPEVVLATVPGGTYKTAPTMSGSASDNQSVKIVEYSLDGGENWLPMDQILGLGGSQVSFSFTPQNLKDGNYPLVIRAIDSSGNQAKTKAFALVIDVLPPIVGGNVISIGSQPVLPNNNNVLATTVGLEHKIALSAVGGPTTINLVTKTEGDVKTIQSFNLTHAARTGLWNGVLSFSRPGTFQLIAQSMDGAGNSTSRLINTVEVKAAGKVTDGIKTLPDAALKVYYRDRETNEWVLWDGAAYDQANPSQLSSTGEYGFFLPEGTYYIKISAPGYRSIITDSFSLVTPSAISTDFKLTRSPGIDLGPLHLRLPWPSFKQEALILSESVGETEQLPVLDQFVPQFNLDQTDGRQLSSLELLGKPTMISFVSTWAGPAQEQLAKLSKLDSQYFNIVIVGSGESLAKLTAYLSVAGISRPILADVDHRLVEAMGVGTIPTTFFIDQRGIVKEARVGVVSSEELADKMMIKGGL